MSTTLQNLLGKTGIKQLRNLRYQVYCSIIRDYETHRDNRPSIFKFREFYAWLKKFTILQNQYIQIRKYAYRYNRLNNRLYHKPTWYQ